MLKFIFTTHMADGTPGSSHGDTQTPSETPREALTRVMRAAADVFDNEGNENVSKVTVETVQV